MKVILIFQLSDFEHKKKAPILGPLIIIKGVLMKRIICAILLSAFSLHAHELMFLANLKQAIKIDNQTYAHLIAQANNEPINKDVQCSTSDRPLFKAYPALRQTISHISLGSFPTPLHRCDQLTKVYDIQNLSIKQDSISGGILSDDTRLFGGNKVRKLEFLLADAVYHNAQSVLTFGCIGSNHATATATYARELGFRCYLMLTPQPDSAIVHRNLNLMSAANAEIIFSANATMRMNATTSTFIASKKDHGTYPYFIPTGGSTPIGVIGFVNAAFELREQINNGLLTEPDYIYVATGSCGTTAGLALGLKAAGIRSQIIAVCVEPEEELGFFERKIAQLFRETNQLLNDRDATFPLFGESVDNVMIVHDFSGPCYGLCMPEVIEAIEEIEKYENVILDGTYTGKAFTAILSHAKQGLLQDKNVLFWNTFDGEVK